MFACTSGVTNKEIHIYNYYTNECPKSMQYIGHTNRVRSIAWFENDMGFASTGWDGNIYFYDLYGSVKDMQKRNDEFDYPIKDVKMQCLSTIPGSATKYDVLAVGNDR
jgi:WD40 repeat protein